MTGRLCLCGGLLVIAAIGCQKDESLGFTGPAGSGGTFVQIGDGDDQGSDPTEPITDGGAIDDTAPEGDAAADGDAGGDGDVPDAPDASADLPPDLPVDLPVETPPRNLSNGTACKDSEWCLSRFCVDGFCCDSACESDAPMRCHSCAQASTGQKNGTCASDRTREDLACGHLCGQLGTNLPAVLTMTCHQGACLLPAVPVVAETCSQPTAPCSTSFCDQPALNVARCVIVKNPMNCNQ